MLNAKSKARKQNLGLTVTQATSQARRHVDKIMPGVMATVDSRTSYDLKADVPIVITTITFPRNHAARHLLVKTIALAMNDATLIDTDSRITITRTR